ncbi:SNF2 family N-terminal domain-containing protein [Aspergillus undulatus]|uniref:SNF2 family N-terminal domain-containing protein n=1 Tax=Aspergillus undulatus TaxID=1810928 RepID=UPI003CCD0E14
MASFAEQTIEEIEEELDLQRVILESLDSSHCSRPDAAEQRLETVEAIKELETKLAELRGNGTSASPHRRFSFRQSVPITLGPPPAQFDGSVFSRPTIPSSPPSLSGPQQFGRPAFSTSISTLPQDPRSDTFTGMPTTRKRRYGDDDKEDAGQRSSKRTAAHRTAAPAYGQPDSSASASRRSSIEGADSEDNADDFLLDMLGLDSQNMRELQEEQRQAEKWLEERREQERRDAEYARTLMAHEEAPPSIPTSQSASSVRPSEASSRWREILPQRAPQPSSPFPQFTSIGPAAGEVAPPSYTNTVYSGPQSNSARSLPDSDDSDFAEITPWDFHASTGRPPVYPTYNHYLTPYAPNPGNARPSMPNGAGSIRNPYSYVNPIPGPSSAGNIGPDMWTNPMEAAWEKIRGAGDRLMDDLSYLGTLPSQDPLSNVIKGFMDSDGPLSSHDLKDLYDYGGDPKQLNEEIKSLLETIRPDADIPEDEWEGTPEGLKYALMKHQKLGLAWMKSKEESDQKGGILADDMGLGKTIQAISLMVSRPPTGDEPKTTLIIAPVALMQQWKREIQKMLRPGHQLSVYVLHGEKRNTKFSDLKKYDVVLTTFGMMASELKRAEKYEELIRKGAEEPTLAREQLKTLPCLGPTSKWHRVIIDEAQCIKNRNTQSALACCRLDAVYRWCMSGTPMMNNVGELHSLLKFLRIRPYGNLEAFQQDFGRPLKSGSKSQQDKAMTQLRILLKAVLLRRTKDSKIDGEPILNIPHRVTEKVHAAFSEDELELYKALEMKTQLQFNRYLENGTVGRNYSNILVLLLRLRQACCHPHLISDFSVKLNETTEGVDFIANAKEFSDEVVIRLRDNPNLECPICIDAVDNPVIFFPCGHGTCTECFSRISDPSLSLQQGIDGATAVKCPNCRGAVDPKRITDHISFKKVHFPDGDGTSDETGLEGLGTTVEENDDDDDGDDSDEGGTLSDFIVNDSGEGSTPFRKTKTKGKGKAAKKPKKTLAELKKDASKNKESKRKYLRRLEKTWITSAKIEKAMEIVRDVEGRGNDEKTIIFSQFTSLLDLLEVPIAREGYRYRRYDGSMKPADRNSAVVDFTDDPSCKIMLVSLKAGNSGLNLVAANHVIIFDPFWNPYIEEQAIDRAHRIGQMREVNVHRILVPKTVEDRIIELQDKKRALIDGALDEKASKNIARLSTRELAYLFGINNN